MLLRKVCVTIWDMMVHIHTHTVKKMLIYLSNTLTPTLRAVVNRSRTGMFDVSGCIYENRNAKHRHQVARVVLSVKANCIRLAARDALVCLWVHPLKSTRGVFDISIYSSCNSTKLPSTTTINVPCPLKLLAWHTKIQWQLNNSSLYLNNTDIYIRVRTYIT